MFKKSPSKQPDVVPRRRRAQDEPIHEAPFRRGQTLSSYRAPIATDDSARGKAHQLVRQRRNIGAIFGIVFLVIAFLAFLLWQLIAQVEIPSSAKQLSRAFSADAYVKSVNEYLGLHPAERLRLALNEEKLSAFVAERHPEVASLELGNGAGLAKSVFTVTFRTPVAGWQVNNRQYYVDDTGVVFEKNYYDTPPVQIVDESGVRAENGNMVVGNRLLGFLGKVVARAGEKGYVVSKALLPQGGTRQVEISFEGKKTRVKLSIDRGAGEQIEDMDRAIQYLAARGTEPETLDVRVSGRTAYR